MERGISTPMHTDVAPYTLAIPVADSLEEANQALKSLAEAHGASVALLRRTLNDLATLSANLTSTQERCTELLLENRSIRAQYEEAIGRVPLAGSKRNIADAISNAVMLTLDDVLPAGGLA